MNENAWKRFYNYEKGLVVFLCLNLVFFSINEKATLIPFEVSGYFFWLSLGLYIGFRLAKWEIIRVQKRQSAGKKKDENFFSKN